MPRTFLSDGRKKTFKNAELFVSSANIFGIDFT